MNGGLGSPLLLIAIVYDPSDKPADAEPEGIVGLYTASGQYPGAVDGLRCEICGSGVGQPSPATARFGAGGAFIPGRSGRFIPFVDDPDVMVPHCVPCFASGSIRAWETENNPDPTPRGGELIHRCPVGDSGIMPCCGKAPFDVPRDRMTVDPWLVTCGGGYPASQGRCPTCDSPGPEFHIQVEGEVHVCPDPFHPPVPPRRPAGTEPTPPPAAATVPLGAAGAALGDALGTFLDAVAASVRDGLTCCLGKKP